MALPMRVSCVGSILTLAFLSCCCGKRGPSKAAASKQESGDVVADANALHGDFIAALKRLHWSDSDAFETCVLEPETTLYEDDCEEKDPDRWEEFLWRLPALRRDTYDSFWSENERARPIAPLDRGAMKLHVLTRAEAAELKAIVNDDARADYWDIFRTRYGNAVRVGLSAPGFSQDRRQALIYYEAGFEWLGAWGSYCLLKREGPRWEIAAEYCVWQS